jgi:hypothetical protein
MSVDYAREKRPHRQRVLELLWDCRWHSAREVCGAGGVRYSARLLELRRLGYAIESRGQNVDGKDYRLASTTPGPLQGKRVKAFLAEADAESLTAGVVTTGARRAVDEALRSFRMNKEKL